jgi:hypothetical protein
MSDEDVAQTIRGLVQQPGTAAVDVVAAAVRHLADAHPRWGWVGVYLLRADALHLGPYVGPPTETVVGQIDVDSDDVGAFGAADERLLEEVAGHRAGGRRPGRRVLITRLAGHRPGESACRPDSRRDTGRSPACRMSMSTASRSTSMSPWSTRTRTST